MNDHTTRRQFLALGGAALGTSLASSILIGADRPVSPHGDVVGEPTAEKVGLRMLADGGNAMDAIVAAALTAAVAAPHQTGIGGYGMSAIVAFDGGKRIVAIDGNSTAPAAMSADTFQPAADGKVPGRVNETGWLAAGVPGILAGLQLALDRFGTRSFREVVQPAIGVARDGFRWPANLATMLRGNKPFEKDAGSRKLYFPDGQPLAAGVLFKNPELAELLDTLAKANSVDAFYRGDIAQRIAEAFQKNGGLVTARDMAAHQARLVEPLTLKWGEQTVHTAPLTAGGLSALQMLRAMQAMNWEKMPVGFARSHARIEAARLAWRDRLTLLGDPDFARVPVAKLLSEEYARESAEKITSAVTTGKLIAHAVTPNSQTGTISLSAVDKHGNMAALTLTHGQGFGAQVTVDGLGLTLGHGMSRFDPRPDHPNAPGPGKRPLHNMVPTLVTRDGKPVLAIGGRGGRKIPNALFEVLTQFVVLGRPLAESIAAPRMHTEGDATLEFEKAWPEDETESFRKLGYTVKTAGNATLSAVALENGSMHAAMR
jgi:gamma-glutamyltranspeptidase/glutathione hydrolase